MTEPELTDLLKRIQEAFAELWRDPMKPENWQAMRRLLNSCDSSSAPPPDANSRS